MKSHLCNLVFSYFRSFIVFHLHVGLLSILTSILHIVRLESTFFIQAANLLIIEVIVFNSSIHFHKFLPYTTFAASHRFDVLFSRWFFIFPSSLGFLLFWGVPISEFSLNV